MEPFEFHTHFVYLGNSRLYLPAVRYLCCENAQNTINSDISLRLSSFLGCGKTRIQMSLRKPGVHLRTRNNLLFLGKWAETLCWNVRGYPYLKVKHWFQWESPPWRWESRSGPSPRRLSPSPALQGSPAGKTWLVGALGSSCGHQSSPPHI